MVFRHKPETAAQRRIDARRRKEAARRAKEEEERQRAWAATDHGRAQLAYDAGELFFQMQRVISTTRGQVFVMVGASAFSAEADQSAEGITGLFGSGSDKLAQQTENLPITQTLAIVEQIGWRLVHLGYTYRETYSVSRDKFLSSGQQTAMSGEIVAIHLFRREELTPVTLGPGPGPVLRAGTRRAPARRPARPGAAGPRASRRIGRR